MQESINNKTMLDRELSARASCISSAKTPGSPGHGLRAILKKGRKNAQDSARPVVLARSKDFQRRMSARHVER